MILPSIISTIEKCAFIDCVELTHVEIAGGLDVIEQGAFHGCRNLRLIISGCKVINQEFSASTGVSHVEFRHELDGFAAYAFNHPENNSLSLNAS
jgi:hypothetical protein